MIRHRIRLRFTKLGTLRLIGHRDLLRAWERLIRRAGLPLSMTEGFHPKPRVNFPSALAVGIAGVDEVLELELSETWTAEQFLEKVSPQCPPGLEIRRVEVIPPGEPKPYVRSVTLEIPVPEERRAGLPERIAALMASETQLVEREQRTTPLDIRRYLELVSLEESGLRMRLLVEPTGSARPREILVALGLEDLEDAGAYLTRIAVELHTQKLPNESSAGADYGEEFASCAADLSQAEKDHP